jgi:serine/threonine protein kinase
MEGEKYGIAVDMFSFGCLLYDLCNGSNPFDV